MESSPSRDSSILSNDDDDRPVKSLAEVFTEIASLVRTAETSSSSSSSSSQTSISNSTKLRLYGYYKQATVGPTSSGNAPPLWKFEAKAKHDAWYACHDLSSDEAMHQYIQLIVHEILPEEADTDDDEESSSWGNKCRRLWEGYQQQQTEQIEQQQAQQQEADLEQETISQTDENANRRTEETVDDYHDDDNDDEFDSIMFEEESPCLPTEKAVHQKSSLLIRILASFYSWLCSWIPPPLIPRGQLDISYSLLLSTIASCLWGIIHSRHYYNSEQQCRLYEQRIAKLWNTTKHQNPLISEQETPDNNSILVGLSVRSLLDLYLLANNFPPGSEIILAPAINVPGMVRVLQHHQITIVGVDVPEDEEEEESNIDGNDQDADQNDRPPVYYTMKVDLDGIRQKLTDKTVAIMVVHPFGRITASENDWKELRALAKERQIHLLEDCAQVYSGGLQSTTAENRYKKGYDDDDDGYRGSSYADISLFSFGLIKTATALGGGVAVVRHQQQRGETTNYNNNNSHMADKMNRLQWSRYNLQPPTIYLWVALKALFLRLLTHNVYVYSLVFHSLRWLGVNVDTLATRLSRAFDMNATYDPESSAGPDPFLNQIRQKPCVQLVETLCKQLQERSTTKHVVQRRKRHCRILESHLDSSLLLFPKDVAQTTTHWLFPIRCNTPPSTTRIQFLDNIRFNTGVDIAQSASQLICIDDQCTRAVRLMQSIMYLPVSLPTGKRGLSIKQMKSLSFNLSVPTKRQPFAPLLRLKSSQSSKEDTAIWNMVICYLLALWFYLRYPEVLISASMVGASLFVVICLVLGALLWTIGGFYLNHCNAFEKYCWMLGPDNDKSPTKENPCPKILESMESLKLPMNNDKPESRTIFLTGATGFVGSLILHDLIKYREKLRLKRVIVLSRAKRGRAAKQRIDRLLSLDIFGFVTQEDLESLVQVVDGDVSKPDLGLSPRDLEILIEDNSISHVIHSAASVSFTQSISSAAKTNISGPLNVQNLTERMSNKNVVFIHMSTAFVHGSNTGSPSSPLGETLFSFESFDPESVYRSMLNPTSQYLAEKCMLTLDFPNTYTFSKSICEHLLTKSKVKTIIMRPSIVGPSAQHPREGWAGTKPSTFVAAACLYFHFQWNLWCFGPQQVPCIPVDVLSQFVLKCIMDKGEDDRPKTTNSMIRNAAWDYRSPQSSQFTWLNFAVTVMQFGTSLGYFNRLTAYIGLFVSRELLPRMNLSQARFRQLHMALIVRPYKALMKIAAAFGVETSGAEQLLPYLDLPLLFFPFATNSFYFASPLVAPKDFCGERYSCSCIVAAHTFSKKTDPRKKNLNFSHVNILHFRGRSILQDALWAFTQPCGSMVERVTAWMLSSILQRTCSEITVDLFSLAKSLQASDTEKPKRFLLLPTHRSFFDFLLISYVCFSLPELHLELPVIAAAADFERLPVVGLLLRLFRVLFVTRGIGKSGLKKAEKGLCSLIDNQPLTLEIYIEGTRSRDRRFSSPKTGLLRSIHDLDDSFVVLPITLSYEKIAEQDALVTEASGNFSSGLRVGPLLSWLNEVFRGVISLGRIHFAVGESLKMNDFKDPSMRTLALEVQKRQQELVLISPFHVTAAASVLCVSPSTVKAAYDLLGCKAWQRGITRPLELPKDPSARWTIALQGAHLLAPIIRSELPQWATWLCKDESRQISAGTLSSVHVQALAKSLILTFSEAESSVSSALKYLKSKGFNHPSPEHLFQISIQNGCKSPRILLKAALSIVGFDFSKKNMHIQSAIATDHSSYIIQASQERLGFWGFHGTSFALKCGKMGIPYVTITGERYPLRNKKITKLLPFIEKATGVKLDPLRGGILSSFTLDQKSSSSVLTINEIEKLRSACSEVSTTISDRTRHGTGHSLSDVLRIRRGEQFRVPDVVVWPSSVGEVESIVSLAQECDWCLIPFGGGTTVSRAVCCPSLEQEPRPIISVDMRRMNRVLLVDHENGIAQVEAGITGLELIQELKRRGFTMGHEPDSLEFSTLGGWIATKASGMKRNKYGNIEEIVTGVRVVGKGGLMEQGHFGRVSCGLDLTSLMLGSEGCLGIIVSAVIRIKDLPQVTDHDSILLPDFETGVRLMKGISRLGAGRIPASCRLLDNEHFRMGRAMKPENESSFAVAKEYFGSAYVQWRGFDESRIVCLALGFEGSESEVRTQKGAIAQLAKSFGGLSLGRRVGKASYGMTFMIAYLRDFALTYGIAGESFETFAPWSEIHSIVNRTKARIEKEHRQNAFPGRPFVGCRITQIYSEGVCLYFYLCMSINGIDGDKQLSSFSHLEEAARSEILATGGSLSHHHGIGKLRAEFMPLVQSSNTHDAFQRIKSSMDPDNIFGAQNGSFASRDDKKKH